jgi:putative transposase
VRRVPPSTVIREEIDQLLTGGVGPRSNIISTLADLGLRYLAQHGLEQEQEDFLRRAHYERRDDRSPRGYRNGYEDASIKTAEGEAAIRIPQVRQADEPYRSKLMEFLEGNSDVLERLVVEMYARGLSVRDVEDCFRDATGALLISKTAVSEITDQLWEHYQTFCHRDLSEFEVCYLFLDSIYESLRRYGAKEGILAAWAITTDGRKVLLHLGVGNKESEACWTEFLRNMVSRGLRIPLSVTSDGAPGLLNAIAQVFPASLRIRCWYHKMGNIRAKLSADDAPEVLAHVRAVRDAATHDAGCALAARVIETFADRFPSAMACLSDDLEASLAHLKLPVRHRINVRTTNLLERSFEEERRRTKVIPRLLDEKSAMKLVFATLIRCSDRWNRVSISDLERQQLRLLRRQLGIDPEPEPTTKPKHARRQKQTRRGKVQAA